MFRHLLLVLGLELPVRESAERPDQPAEVRRELDHVQGITAHARDGALVRSRAPLHERGGYEPRRLLVLRRSLRGPYFATDRSGINNVYP